MMADLVLNSAFNHSRLGIPSCGWLASPKNSLANSSGLCCSRISLTSSTEAGRPVLRRCLGMVVVSPGTLFLVDSLLYNRGKRHSKRGSKIYFGCGLGGLDGW